MRLGNVPIAQSRCFVDVLTEANAGRNLAQQVGKTQFVRDSFSRIAAQHDQRVNVARVQLLTQSGNRLCMGQSIGIGRFGIDDRLADIAKHAVQCRAQRVCPGRLPVSGDNDAFAPVRDQVFGQRLHSLLQMHRQRWRGCRDADLLGISSRQLTDGPV